MSGPLALHFERPERSELGRHHELFTDKFEHGGKGGGPIEGRITVEFVEPPKRNK